MNIHKAKLQKSAGLVSAICGSLIIGLPAIPLAASAVPNRTFQRLLLSQITPPLPETRSNAIARVTPKDGKVDVKLKNNTNTFISYEALGYTDSQLLGAGEEIVLLDLPTPVTITTVRQDKGLLNVIPVSNSQQGMLEISLDEAKTLGDNLGALRIQRDGQVFLN